MASQNTSQNESQLSSRTEEAQSLAPNHTGPNNAAVLAIPTTELQNRASDALKQWKISKSDLDLDKKTNASQRSGITFRGLLTKITEVSKLLSSNKGMEDIDERLKNVYKPFMSWSVSSKADASIAWDTTYSSSIAVSNPNEETRESQTEAKEADDKYVSENAKALDNVLSYFQLQTVVKYSAEDKLYSFHYAYIYNDSKNIVSKIKSTTRDEVKTKLAFLRIICAAKLANTISANSYKKVRTEENDEVYLGTVPSC